MFWVGAFMSVPLVLYVAVQLLRKFIRSHGRLDVNYKDDVIYIHVFPRRYTKKVVNLSPYGIKVETWLRMRKIPHEVVETRRFSRTSRQIPYMILNGVEYVDSNLIIDKIMEVHNLDPSEGLSAPDEAVSRAFGCMLDEHTAWTYFLYRYVYHTGMFSKYFQTDLPWLLRKFVFVFLMKKFLSHSLRRKPQGLVMQIANKDLRALSNFLGDKEYFMGAQPTRVDCTLFGHLSQVLYPDMPYPQKDYIKSECPNLLAYMERIRTTYWPDWDDLVDQGTFH